MNKNYIAIIIAAALCVTVMQLPSSISEPGLVISSPGYQPASEGYGHISGVPYQWQEINGFCQWSALSMALRHAGAPLELHNLFAASGIGFSAGYIRYEDLAVFLPGAMLRQMEPLPTIANLYGLNIDIYMDDDIGIGIAYGPAMAAWGLNYTDIEGWTGTLDLIRTTVDDGYPLAIWTDPYYLPPSDYDFARTMGIQSVDTGSGHAVLCIGYNDTASEVIIMDPGVGAFGENFGFPDDGRWLYSVNYSTLQNAMKYMGYGSVVVQTGSGPPDDFESMLASYICERLRGVRSSYGEGLENVFYANFGADAFRGLSYDLTKESIIAYLDDVSLNKYDRYYTLIITGLQIEMGITLQYLSYRESLKTLPRILADLDLEAFLESASLAVSHLALLSENASLIDPYYSVNGTILTQTLTNIANLYNETDDLEAAIEFYEQDIEDIRDHLTAISDAWDAAADTLEAALHDTDITVQIVVVSGLVIVIAVVVILYRRRSS
ncbi:MAG: C39 family peptidase [Candidatus Thorarchaeota archaeon]